MINTNCATQKHIWVHTATHTNRIAPSYAEGYLKWSYTTEIIAPIYKRKHMYRGWSGGTHTHTDPQTCVAFSHIYSTHLRTLHCRPPLGWSTCILHRFLALRVCVTRRFHYHVRVIRRLCWMSVRLFFVTFSVFAVSVSITDVVRRVRSDVAFSACVRCVCVAGGVCSRRYSVCVGTSNGVDAFIKLCCD